MPGYDGTGPLVGAGVRAAWVDGKVLAAAWAAVPGGFGRGVYGRPRWGWRAFGYGPFGPGGSGYGAAPQDEVSLYHPEHGR